MTRWRTWRQATAESLYGPGGFYRRPEGPAGHFRTSIHVGDVYVGAIATLARAAGLRTLVDVGAGRGELAAACTRVAPDLEVVGVEIGRPGYAAEVPAGADALVLANEWLDNVPVDVVELTEAGPRLVEVDDAGAERRGPAPTDDDQDWLDRWWPLGDVGSRAEVGWPRDAAWADVVSRLARGIALAVDYGHTREGRPASGTLTGYRRGRQVPPVPDGRHDLTAHVAVDACASAGIAAGATETTLTSQRAALRALGVDGRQPAHASAASDPAGYVRALGLASAAAELLDPTGLGGFVWLAQGVGLGLPARLRSTPAVRA